MEESESDYQLCPAEEEEGQVEEALAPDVSSTEEAVCASLNDAPLPPPPQTEKNDIKLAIAFVSMVIVATAVSVMGKLVVRSCFLLIQSTNQSFRRGPGLMQRYCGVVSEIGD